MWICCGEGGGESGYVEMKCGCVTDMLGYVREKLWICGEVEGWICGYVEGVIV